MKKYLFAFDLDGTLLNGEETISDVSLAGIRKLEALGHYVSIITGRSWNMAKHIYEKSELKSPIGIFNGGIVFPGKDEKFKLIKRIMPQEKVAEVIKNNLFKEIGKNYSIETFKEAFTTDLNSKMAMLNKKWSKITSTLIPKNHDVSHIDEIISIIAEIKIDDKKADILAEKLEKEIGDINVRYWKVQDKDEVIMIITNKQSRKDHALVEIAKYYGIDIKDTIAFGDASNDDHMLMKAGLGVAMKNGREATIKIANTVTHKTNLEDGVMDYIFSEIIK